MNLINRKKRRIFLLLIIVASLLILVLWHTKKKTSHNEDIETFGSIQRRNPREAGENQVEIIGDKSLGLEDADLHPRKRREDHRMISPLVPKVDPKRSYLKDFTDSTNDYDRETNPPMILKMNVICPKNRLVTANNKQGCLSASPSSPTPKQENQPGFQLQVPVEVQPPQEENAVKYFPGKHVDDYQRADVPEPQSKSAFKTTGFELYEYEIYTTPQLLYDYSSTIEIFIPNPKLAYDEYPLNF